MEGKLEKEEATQRVGGRRRRWKLKTPRFPSQKDSVGGIWTKGRWDILEGSLVLLEYRGDDRKDRFVET